MCCGRATGCSSTTILSSRPLGRLREVSRGTPRHRGGGVAGPLIESIAAELDEQEALVEDFKSAHALLRNSLTYFGHLSRELGTSTSQAGEDVAIVVGRLANSMFRFVGGSADEAEAAEVAALLDRALRSSPRPPRSGTMSPRCARMAA